MTRVVVDADYLVYFCGFAVEKVLYDVSVKRPDGTTDEAVFKTKDEVDAYCIEEPAGSVVQIDRLIEAEPLDHALFLVNRTLHSMEEKLTEAGLEFDRLELFLTGKGNFRDSLATIRGYKANRVESRRPVHYKSIRRYLKNRWGAEVVDGFEADDAVAWAAAAGEYDPARVCVVSVDKDLATVPGLHYNFKHKLLRVITLEEAQINFYRQLVTGDTVDNICGAYKAGAAAAFKAVQPGMSEDKWYANVLALYAAGLEKPNCPYAGMDAADALLENARLLWMTRAPHDVWLPPHERPRDPGTSIVPGLNGVYAPSWMLRASPMITKGAPSTSASQPQQATSAGGAPGQKSIAASATRRTSSSGRGSSKRRASSPPGTAV